MAESAKEARREKDLQRINTLQGYIDEDSDHPDTQGTETLRAARKKLVLNENALQYKEHETATDTYDAAKQWDDIMTSFEKDNEGVNPNTDSKEKLKTATDSLDEHTTRSAAFAAQHLDVLREEAIKLAKDEDDVDINVESDPSA